MARNSHLFWCTQRAKVFVAVSFGMEITLSKNTQIFKALYYMKVKSFYQHIKQAKSAALNKVQNSKVLKALNVKVVT